MPFSRAQPGKGSEVAAFLESGREIVEREEGTVTWYAFKIAETTYGICDTFESEEARQAHLNGEIPQRSHRWGTISSQPIPTFGPSRSWL